MSDQHSMDTDFVSYPDSEITSGPPSKRKKRSAIWSYFSRSSVGNETKIVCLSCPRQFSAASATSTIIRHAKTHGFFLAERQSTLTPGLTLGKERSNPSEAFHDRVLKDLCRWIVDSGIPFSTVENDQFKRFMATVNGSISVPSRFTVQRYICKERDDLQLRVQDLLRASTTRIGLTTDAWSSRVFRGYIVISAHWIDDEWNLRSCILTFESFPSPHTGRAFSDLLLRAIADWKLTDRLQGVTTDNGSDICAGIRLFHEELMLNDCRLTQLSSFQNFLTPLVWIGKVLLITENLSKLTMAHKL